MKASLVWYALACGMLWACDSSNGTQENPGQDVMEDSWGLAEVDSSVPVGDIDFSSDQGDDQGDAPLEGDVPPLGDATDASEGTMEEEVNSFELVVALIPNTNEDLPVDYESVKVVLFQGAVSCSTLGAVTVDPQGMVMEKTISSIEATPAFGPLNISENYTVLVRVFRDEGNQSRVVAWGCTDGILADSEATTTGSMETQVELQTVVLDSEGSYDYFEEYTLDEATLGPVLTQLLSPVERLINEPGILFLGFFDAQLLPALSGVSDAAYHAFQAELADAVAAQLLLNMPVPFNADVQSVVAPVLNPRFEGTLELVQEGTDVTASLTDRRVVLTWEINGQPQVWAKPLGEVEPQEEEPPVFAWSGQLHDVTLLNLNLNDLHTDLGAIMGEFLALMVFPVLTGVPTPEDYLNSLFDCTAIAGAVSVEALAGIGLTSGGLYDVCTATLGAMDETILTPLETSSIPVTLSRQGTCVVTDGTGEAEDNDLVVEELTEGILTGSSLYGAEQANLSGTFGAIRIPPAN